MEPLLHAPELADDEQACWVASSHVVGDDLRLRVVLGDPYDEAEDGRPLLDGRVFDVVCHDYIEAVVVAGHWADVELATDHPLLLDHKAPQAILGFRGNVDAPVQVLGALYAAHRTVVGDWLPLGRFLNEMPTEELLRGGHGTLAFGPLPLLEAYADVLSSFGVRASVNSVRDAMPRTPRGVPVQAMSLVAVVLDACQPERATYVLCRDPEAAEVHTWGPPFQRS